jgi:hypothetical protein
MNLQEIGLENVDWIHLACGWSQRRNFMNTVVRFRAR